MTELIEALNTPYATQSFYMCHVHDLLCEDEDGS